MCVCVCCTLECVRTKKREKPTNVNVEKYGQMLFISDSFTSRTPPPPPDEERCIINNGNRLDAKF